MLGQCLFVFASTLIRLVSLLIITFPRVENLIYFVVFCVFYIKVEENDLKALLQRTFHPR